jgi:primosomal protein N'
MNYLILILGGIIGYLIYYIHKKENTKICQYCGETIKKQAIVCKHCGRDLVTPVGLITKEVNQIKKDIIDDNLKKLSAMASLTVSKKILEAQIFVLQGVKLLGIDKKRKK